MKLDLILENVRNKYSLGLLEESEGMDEKQILQGKILINESTMNIRSMLVDEGIVDNVKNYLQESWEATIIEEEMSPIAKKGMALAGAGTGLAMGHAGAFGGGVKNLVDSAGTMGAGMADRASTHVGNAFNKTGKFYSPNSDIAKPAAAQADHSVHQSQDAASDAGDDEDGLGVLGTIGAGTLAAGAGYLGLKGAKAAGKTKTYGDMKMGARGGSVSNPGVGFKTGRAYNTARTRLGRAGDALRGR